MKKILVCWRIVASLAVMAFIHFLMLVAMPK